jgi:N6-adenosine-specific RNA methylase IME4
MHTSVPPVKTRWRFICSTVTALLPRNTRYQILLIDPPWTYYGDQTKWGAAAKFYPTLDDETISNLPVMNWLEPPGVVFLWATGPKLESAIWVIEEWGLFYRGVAFVWVKTKRDRVTPIGAQGVRPSIVKPTTEYVLAASTQKKGRPLPIADESVQQVVLAPKQEHSQKPETVQDRIEQLYPTASKAELFARRHRTGWDCYGDELL